MANHRLGHFLQIPIQDFDRSSRPAGRWLGAAARTLEPLNAKSRDDGKQRPLVYRGMKQVKSFRLSPNQEDVTSGVTLSFSYGPDGETLLDRQQDADLIEGVIPYDPQRNAPMNPAASGTSFTLASCQYPAGFIDESVTYDSYSKNRSAPGGKCRNKAALYLVRG
jgi:cholesterol oxidase